MYDCKHCYKSIKRDRAERFVDEEVVRFLASSVALRAAMQDLAPESPNGNTLVEQNALRERLKALTEDFYLYAKIPESIYHSTVDSINSRILELEDSLVRENQIPLTSFDPDDYLEMDPADKRAFLKLLFDAIIVRPDGTSRRDDRLVYVYSEAASAPETD